jgi:outer membrane protein assembly factor BamB
MRPRTVLAVSLVVVLAGGLAIAGVALDRSDGTELSVSWVSETGGGVEANHHAVAAGRIGGEPVVFAPVSDRPGSDACALVALHGSNGSRRWAHPVPAANCTVHAVADPTLADFDGDGVREVIAATTERTVTAYGALDGAVEFRANLTSYGYTKPIVADLVGDRRPELVAVDVSGSILVHRADGSVAWSRQLSAFTWGQPAVADFDADGAPELAVGLGGTGELHLYERRGSAAWNRTPTVEGSITWMTTGQVDDDAAVEVVVATAAGVVSAIDGASGEREWTRQFGAFAAVKALGDGDGDGQIEVYAVARDGVLRSLDGATGATEWTTTLTTGDVQMTPPPAMGDLDGDGEPELLAVTNDGIVSALDPASGEVLSTYERDVAILADPTLADTDGDGVPEAFVIYADGRVVALDAGS